MKNWWLLLGLMTTLLACHRPAKIVEAQGEVILIDSTFDAIQDSDYVAYIAPIKADLERELNTPIG